MGKLEELNRLNSFPVFSLEDSEFQTYGRIIRNVSGDELIRCAEENREALETGTHYTASFRPFEELEESRYIQSAVFGGMPMQAGYCYGDNRTFNGFEYHKALEINIAVTDMALALGHSWEIGDDLSFDMNKAKVFFVPKGTVVEMYGTTLHLSPLMTQEGGFRSIVLLPKGVNTPLSDEEKNAALRAFSDGEKEARILQQKGKWIIVHPERTFQIEQGIYPGVTGDNPELRF